MKKKKLISLSEIKHIVTLIMPNKWDTPWSRWQTIPHPFDDVVHKKTNAHSHQNGLDVDGQLQHDWLL